MSTNDFTSAYKTKLDNLDTNLSAKANTSAVLTKTNTTAFTPTEDYQPATKKYVDDHSSTVKLADNLTTEDGTIALSAKQGKLLNDNKVDKSSVLLKDNTTEFTPTADYQPATKKYVDDNKTQIADNLTTEDSGKALSAKQGKILNNNKVDKVSGKGLSTNDYTDAEKAEVAKVKDKANVDDVLTKTNATEFTPTSDYHPATKKYVDDFINDAFMMEYEINDSDGGTLLDSNGQPILSRVNVTDAVSELDKNKVDKVSGKDLSTNDFTDTYKSKLDNLDSSLSTKAPAYSYSTTDLTAGTSALATGKLYFVYE